VLVQSPDIVFREFDWFSWMGRLSEV